MNLHGKASVLAVGSELTAGQITNRNAPWISEKLTQLGATVVLHETVADDRQAIHDSLKRCAEVSELVFVTGGLGPTSDDFTREVVASWLGRELIFDEDSWQRTATRIKGFGISVAPSNRQQCFFPEGSEVIPNDEGTASAFTSAFGDSQRIWVLPGPPAEVKAVWERGVEKGVRQSIPGFKPDTLLTWQCMGKSESEVGEITDKILAGSFLQTGYRAHRPFVEVKVWIPQGELENKKVWIENLEEALAPWVFTRQGEDLAETLLNQLGRYSYISIMDRASQGGLVNRVGKLLTGRPLYASLAPKVNWISEFGSVTDLSDWASVVLQYSDADQLTLVIGGFDSEGRCVVGLKEGSRLHQKVIDSPWPKIELLDRTRLYSVEMALKLWIEWLNS